MKDIICKIVIILLALFFWIFIVFFLYQVFKTTETSFKHTELLETAHRSLQTLYFEELELEVILTAYNPVWWQTDSTPLITASNKKVEEGMIACPTWLNFGDWVYYNGEYYTCEDRMNKKKAKGNYFDILMFDYHEAIEFGVKKETVLIYKFI